MQALTSIKRVADKVIEWLCIAILAVMTILVTYQGVTRYVFDESSAISEILAQYLFVWMVMFGSAYVFGLKEHLDITVLKDKMPPALLLIVEILTNVVLVAFSTGVLLYGGALVTNQQMGTADAALQIPMGVIYCAIPVCGAFILFYAIYNVCKAVYDYKNGLLRAAGTDDAGTTM